MVWGALGAPGGVFWKVWGSSGLPDAKKLPKRGSLDPPWPPQLEPKIVQNRNVGGPAVHFVAQSVSFGSICGGSWFRQVFWRSKGAKNYLCEGVNLQFFIGKTVVFVNFLLFHKIGLRSDFASIRAPILAPF